MAHFAINRSMVGIYYKKLESEEDYTNTSNLVGGWDGFLLVSDIEQITNDAYRIRR